MTLASWLKRVGLLGLSAALPVMGLGWVIAQSRGMVIALILLFALGLLAAFRVERGMLKIYRVRAETPQGLSRSLSRVMAGMGGRAPALRVFNDPAPQALVVRGPLSVGTLLLSEGALGALDEGELRSLLQSSIVRLRSRGIRFQSFCAWLAHHTLELAPRAWMDLMFGELRWHESLGALAAFRFLVLFSVARFFVSLGRMTALDAPRALARLPRVSGEVINPGSGILHFGDPWASRSLFVL